VRFRAALAERQPDPAGRRWVFVPYDQLTDVIGPLAAHDPAELGIVLVETTWKPRRRPYHVQKLALLLTNLRHFALEQVERGVAVDHRVDTRPYDAVLGDVAAERGPLVCMRPAERELRAALAPLVAEGSLSFVPHEGWLTTTEDFVAGAGTAPPWRMDQFYRHIRQRTGILMQDGKPDGGRYSFDADNREPWRGEPAAPEAPQFVVDPITADVGELIEARFAHHPGRLDLEAIPATLEDARRLRSWAREACLEHFGPYEDAFSRRSRGLFHTRLAPLVNLCRVLPRDLLDDALQADIPLNSKEGFVRQVLGWREFVRHVHEATDGFRELPGETVPIRGVPGDAGWAARHGGSAKAPAGPDGGAAPSALGAHRPLPGAFWGDASGLACLDATVSDVLDHGWTHHIPRLMILANLATLLDVEPRALTDWFWVAFVDAYDWVVEPNVLGMGTFGAGGIMTTKPYVSGARYIDKMGDHCEACVFDPKTTCPITDLYWAFLERNHERLADDGRMRLILGGLRRRPEARRRADQRIFETVWERLGDGEAVSPVDVATAREG
jgi:deoxyribodipyrimidine photolyase-related protein